MNHQKKKCSQIEHQENDAIYYCQECNLYMCNKCDSHHSILFKNHQRFTLDKDINEIFTGYCKKENHSKELQYFCKDHNELCCVSCISKIKDEKNGQHKDCNVCSINDIKNEKKYLLKENIQLLEEISKNIENFINEFKQFNEKVNNKKDELKKTIQRIFTKIRNELNYREDKLCEEIDIKFGELFVKEDIVKNCEKLPSKIQAYLMKGKIKDDDWKDDNKLNILINDSIEIENNTKEINNIYFIIKKAKLTDFKYSFIPEEKGLNVFLEKIKSFGSIQNEGESNIDFDNISTIIENKDNLNFIIRQVKLNNNIKLENGCTLKILYRTSRDGDSCKTYHSKTNEIPDTLTIIKTKENAIFGGYTHIKIPSCKKGQNFYDDKAFVFSLDYQKIYFPQENTESKHSNDNYGPIFGNNQKYEYPILIYGPNFLSIKNHRTSTIKGSFYDNFTFDYELNLGKKNFEIEEIEVYQIFFE